jgi:hypothetical protein
MAEEIRLIDDIDGTADGVEKVEFSIDGRNYTIDLSKPNRERFHEAVAVFVQNARPAGKAGKPGKQAKSEKLDMSVVRAWIRGNGGEISDYGRVPRVLVEAYHRKDPSAIQSAA